MAQSPALPLPGPGTWASSSLQAGKEMSVGTVACAELITAFAAIVEAETLAFPLRGRHPARTRLCDHAGNGHCPGTLLWVSVLLLPQHLSP